MLDLNVFVESICLNIDCDIILVDRQFLSKQSSTTIVKTKFTSIFVIDIDDNKHEISEYVVVTIHVFDLNKQDKSVVTKIIREAHVVDELKVKMFIDTDVIESKQIDIMTSSNQTSIDNCDVTISIKLQASSSRRVKQTIQADKTIVIFSHSQLVILFRRFSKKFLSNRDFLFESVECNLSLYAHVVNVITDVILTRNEIDKSITLSRKFRFDIINELSYDSCCNLAIEDNDLVVKSSKTVHQTSWMKKFCVIALTAIDVIMSIVTSTITSSNVSTIIVLTIVFVVQTTFKLKITLSNDVNVFEDNVTIETLTRIVNDYSNLWRDRDFIDLSQDEWMRISLKKEWITFDKTKMYSLRNKNKKIVDKIFDELHEQDKLMWTNRQTSFNYSMFVVWKTLSIDEKKNRAIVDIRELNRLLKFDAYFISLQDDIIALVRDCAYIIVVDATFFFYQWRVHSNDRHKLIVVTYREQETFCVFVMSCKNSSTYVQRQIDRIFRSLRHCVRVYVDDVVIFFKTFEEHVSHLRAIFDLFVKLSIFIKSSKAFFDYSNVQLLDQHVDFFDLSIAEDKLKVISMLRFSRTLREFEIYLDMTNWLRQYVSYYV